MFPFPSGLIRLLRLVMLYHYSRHYFFPHEGSRIESIKTLYSMVSTQQDLNQQNQLIQERGQGLHLHVKETFLSLTHDDFVVINEITGEKLFTVTRKLTSVRKQRKTLYDASGNVLWTVEHPTFRLFHRRYRFYNDKGRKIFIIRSHHRLMPSQGRKLTMSTDDGNEIISKGSTFDAKTAIDLVTREGSRKQWKPLARVMNPVVSTRGYF